MLKRALAVNAPDSSKAQVTDTGNQPRRLRLIGDAAIGSVGRSCERMRSDARVLNASRAPGPQYDPTPIASDDSGARGCARLIPDAFPRRLRLSPGTGRNTASVRRLRESSTPRIGRHHKSGIYLSQRHQPQRICPAFACRMELWGMSCGKIVGSVICSNEQT